MGKLRFLLALWLAKLSVPALKITRHNGTDFPGSLALKLCPYLSSPSTRSSPSAAGVCPFGGPFWGQTSSNDSSSLFKTSVQTK